MGSASFQPQKKNEQACIPAGLAKKKSPIRWWFWKIEIPKKIRLKIRNYKSKKNWTGEISRLKIIMDLYMFQLSSDCLALVSIFILKFLEILVNPNGFCWFSTAKQRARLYPSRVDRNHPSLLYVFCGESFLRADLYLLLIFVFSFSGGE